MCLFEVDKRCSRNMTYEEVMQILLCLMFKCQDFISSSWEREATRSSQMREKCKWKICVIEEKMAKSGKSFKVVSQRWTVEVNTTTEALSSELWEFSHFLLASLKQCLINCIQTWYFVSALQQLKFIRQTFQRRRRLRYFGNLNANDFAIQLRAFQRNHSIMFHDKRSLFFMWINYTALRR